MLKPQYLQAIQRLHEANIQLVIIGGVALQLHGGVHLTEDIDFSFSPDSENRERLAATMNTLHPQPLGWSSFEPYIITADKLQRSRFLNLKTDLGAIDLLPLPPGIDSFMGLWERATVIALGDLTVRIASLDDLIAMKKAAGRPKDQSHLYELYALKKLTMPEID